MLEGSVRKSGDRLRITAQLVRASDSSHLWSQTYALFLQAREVTRQYNSAALEQAIALYKQALAIDPAYAPAWDGLANVYFGQVDLGTVAPDQGSLLIREAPLKAKPLRNPGQGLDEELQRIFDDQALPYFWFPAVLCVLAAVE